MAVEIEALELSVAHNSQNATNAIGKLVSALVRLRDATAGAAGLNKVVSGLKQLRSALDAVDASGASQALSTVKTSAAAAADSISGMSKQIKDTEKDFALLPGSIMPAKQAISDGTEELKKVSPAIERTRSSAKKAKSTISSLANAFKGLKTQTKGASNGLGRFFNSIKRIFFYRAIRSSLREISSGAKEGVKNLYQYSAALNSIDAASARNTMDAYASTILKVKNSLGAALMPVLQSLLPLIQTFASNIVIALNAVNQFISALQGKDSFTRATDASATFADNMSSAAGSAKEIKEQLNVMGFDELNILEEPNPGGSGGGGGSGSALDYSSMFEEAKIDSAIKDFTDRIKEMIEDGDWRGVGALIAEKLNQAMEKVDWSNFGKKIAEKINNAVDLANGFLTTFKFDKAGENLASAANAMVNSVHWYTIGKTIAAGINGAIDFADNFVSKFEFKNAGSALAKAANGITDNIKYKKIGKTIHKTILGAIEYADGFLKEFHFYNLGNGIGKALQEINITEYVPGLVTVIYDAVAGAIDLVAGLMGSSNFSKALETIKPTLGLAFGGVFWAAIKLGIENLKKKNWEGLVRSLGHFMGAMIRTGKDFVNGIINGFIGAFAKVWVWLQNTFLDENGNLTFWSFSKGMLSLPKQALDGVIDTYKDVADTFSEAFNEGLDPNYKQQNVGDKGLGGVVVLTGDVKKRLTGDVKWLKTHVTGKIKKEFNSTQTTIKQSFTGTGDAMEKSFTSASKSAKEAWNGSSNWFKTNVTEPTGKRFTSLSSDISTGLKNARETSNDAWSGSAAWFKENATDPIKAKFSDLKTNIGTDMGKAWTDTSTAWTDRGTWFSDNAKKPIEKVFTDLKGGIKKSANDSWSEMKGAFYKPINKDNWFGKNVREPITNVFNNTKNKITSAFDGAWTNVKKTFDSKTTTKYFNENLVQPFNKELESISNKTATVTVNMKTPNLKWELKEVEGDFLRQKLGALNIGTSLPQLKVSWYASGAYGIPNGQLFMANEAGPELVGQMNGRNTVANQGQIVEGIRQGVYDAVVSAFANNGGQSNHITVKVGDGTLADIVTRALNNQTRRLGYSQLEGI